ncbi:DUF2062 domain-containing protein [Candidatus Sumerlaeota bacterium]|nr:DUF2062 domain-containing protein [Candidatus Sumerlaeota bacterium]
MIFTKIISYLRRRIPTRSKIKNSSLHRLMGSTIFRRELWQFKPHLMAAGFAVGTFIAFTPTSGVQMLIAGVICLLLKVNLPFSLLATWITNYLTTPFIYYWCYRLGALILGKHLDWHTLTKDFVHVPEKVLVEILPSLWLGGIIVGGIAAGISYAIIFLLASLERKSRLAQFLRQRAKRKKKKVISQADITINS